MFETKKWHVMPAIIATAILSFSGVLIETSMNVTFPKLMSEFHVAANSIQWVTTANLLAVAIIVPLSAFLIKNYSERYIFKIANASFLLGMLIDSLAPNLSILLIGRVLQGIGTGIALPLLFHIILNHVPIAKRGLIMGVATMTTSLAPAIGPTYGGFVLHLFGWKMIFILLFPILLISSIVGLRSIPEVPVQKFQKLNLTAFVSLGIGLSFLLLSIEKMSLLYLLIGLMGLVTFYLSNQRLSLLNLQVFHNRNFVILLYGVFAYQMIPLAISFILPNFLQVGMKLSSIQAGLFLFPASIIAASLYPISGYILDKFGAFKPIALGLSISILGLIAMSYTIMGSSVILLLLSEITVKIGMGFGMSNMITMALTQLRSEESADGNSVLNTLQQFAGAFATAVASQFYQMGAHSGLTNGIAIGSRHGIYFILATTVLSLIGIIYLNAKKGLIK